MIFLITLFSESATYIFPAASEITFDGSQNLESAPVPSLNPDVEPANVETFANSEME